MREIKFRGMAFGEWQYGTYHYSNDKKHHYILRREKFNGDEKPYLYEDEITEVRPETVGEFPGIKDKNGVEIYEGDILRIRGKMGDNSEYSFDALYKVEPITYEGLELRFLRLYCNEPDSKDNSYPICTHPCIRYNSLTNDYVNKKYDQIALPMTSGRNAIQRTSWVEHQYTNDIEITGNIHQHPHLLQ